jgi:hypothetical protein
MVQREFITRSGSLVAFVGAGASITARPRAKEIQLPLRPIRSAEVRQNAEWTVLHPDRVRQGLPGPGNHSRIRSGIARSAPLGIAESNQFSRGSAGDGGVLDFSRESKPQRSAKGRKTQ